MRYRLDTDRGSVRFVYDFGDDGTVGAMPVAAAEIMLDLADPRTSSVTVTLDAAHARAGMFFATQAMRGPEVLDTARHPEIIFRSTAITGTLRAARVEGRLTVRGTTRPVTLDAGLYRQRGTKPDDLDQLAVLLSGKIDRREFGADGFAGFVGPMIKPRIMAWIRK